MEPYTSAQQKTSDNRFTCDTCHISFATQFALHLHKISHAFNVTCNVCDLTFLKIEELDYHIRLTHPECCYYTCTICDTYFTTRPELQTHAINHIETIFPCRSCGTVTNPTRTVTLYLCTNVLCIETSAFHVRHAI